MWITYACLCECESGGNEDAQNCLGNLALIKLAGDV